MMSIFKEIMNKPSEMIKQIKKMRENPMKPVDDVLMDDWIKGMINNANECDSPGENDLLSISSSISIQYSSVYSPSKISLNGGDVTIFQLQALITHMKKYNKEK